MYIFFNFHQFTKRKESNHYESEKVTLRGELALLIVILINSMGVV